MASTNSGCLLVSRLQISKEELPEFQNAVRRWELDWERRWRDTLQDKPLASFLSDDPVSGEFWGSFQWKTLGYGITLLS